MSKYFGYGICPKISKTNLSNQIAYTRVLVAKTAEPDQTAPEEVI